MSAVIGRAQRSSRRPLRIAMIGQKGLPATYGGVEHHVEEIGTRLADRGHRVSVYCREGYGGDDGARDRGGCYRGMHLVDAPALRTKHLDAITHSAASTAKAVVAGADVVHYHALGPGLVAPLPRYASRAAVVMTVHGLDHERAKWGRAARAVLGTAHWMSARVPDRVVVVSRALREHYRSHFGRDVDLISNGVSASRRAPDHLLPDVGGELGRFAMFVGRLVPEKRPDLLLHAFRQVRTDASLLVVGDSSFSDDYTGHLRRLAAQDPRVHLTGFLFGDVLAALYQRASAFVQPSALEGLPLTLLEAVSHDAPVLASDIAPHVEVLGAGSPRHRLVPVDDVPAMAQGLDDLLGRTPEASGPSDRLRQRVMAEHDWDDVTDQLEQVYLEAAGRRAAGVPSTAEPSSEPMPEPSSAAGRLSRTA